MAANTFDWEETIIGRLFYETEVVGEGYNLEVVRNTKKPPKIKYLAKRINLPRDKHNLWKWVDSDESQTSHKIVHYADMEEAFEDFSRINLLSSRRGGEEFNMSSCETKFLGPIVYCFPNRNILLRMKTEDGRLWYLAPNEKGEPVFSCDILIADYPPLRWSSDINIGSNFSGMHLPILNWVGSLLSEFILNATFIIIQQSSINIYRQQSILQRGFICSKENAPMDTSSEATDPTSSSVDQVPSSMAQPAYVVGESLVSYLEDLEAPQMTQVRHSDQVSLEEETEDSSSFDMSFDETFGTLLGDLNEPM